MQDEAGMEEATKDVTMLDVADVVLLRTIVEGCANHPAYRAKRKPKSYCRRCDDVYAAKQKLNWLLEEDE